MPIILHSDLNNFFASCECLVNPELREKPVVVCGKIEDRHGVVLAKNYEAKKFGIKTGDSLFEAMRMCPQLVSVEANFSLYVKYAARVRKIYSEYTDLIEPFGIDEAWLDVTASEKIFGNGEKIASEIRRRVREEIGLTLSIGVSFNKVFAKLGSDMKKPDATTIITSDNFREKVWPLAVEDLIFVGKATKKKLNDMGIYTIGDLANAPLSALSNRLGKWGKTLHVYANGLEKSPVRKYDQEEDAKSIGNSITYYRDLENKYDVHTLLYMLSESVSARLMESNVCLVRTVRIWVVDSILHSYVKQCKLKQPSSLSSDIAECAIGLFESSYDWKHSVRGVGVSVSDFCEQRQIAMDVSESENERKRMLERTIENLRGKFGRHIVDRAIVFREQKLRNLNIKEDHTIHPIGYL